jgi:hypothetical protein
MNSWKKRNSEVSSDPPDLATRNNVADALYNKTTYRQAVRHWKAVWAEAQLLAKPEHPWIAPWMENREHDGNPIFTAVCRSQRRGVHIIHEPCPDVEESDLDWWVDCFGDKNDPEAIRSLVIACCPSRENEDRSGRFHRNYAPIFVLTAARHTAISRVSPEVMRAAPDSRLHGGCRESFAPASPDLRRFRGLRRRRCRGHRRRHAWAGTGRAAVA